MYRSCRYIDSLSFINSGLHEFTNTFGLTAKKGFFPHKFNNNSDYSWNYNGPYLDDDMYGSNHFSNEKKKEYDELIFEGSQGIMLDMDHGVFPNVTYANTTTKNAHDVLDKLGVTDRHVYYITRCYATRHGSGPFPDVKMDLINNEEEINVFNEFQKEFKTAPIDYKMLNQALAFDSIYSNGKVKTKNIVVTCLDQMPNFEFDYKQLNTTFSRIYESNSPKSENFLKKV